MMSEACNDLSGSAWFSLEKEMRPLKYGHSYLRLDPPKLFKTRAVVPVVRTFFADL
jgi:hypothetical protein